MKTIDTSFLFDNYDAVLLDAYGVLVNGEEALPGAKEFVCELHRRHFPFAIVTNDAAKLTGAIEKRFAGFDLDIPEASIISSATLIAERFAAFDLKNKPTVVLGTADSHDFVRQAGGKIVNPEEADDEVRTIVVCEVPSANPMQKLESTLDAAMARLDRNADLDLILCNPDVIFPRGQKPRRSNPSQLHRTYGFTSGSFMLLIETALRTRHAHRMPRISRLGKPYPEIFEAGHKRVGKAKRIALVGDQLPTDIRGAIDYGIDAILIGTGLTQVTPGVTLDPMPTYYLPSLTE